MPLSMLSPNVSAPPTWPPLQLCSPQKLGSWLAAMLADGTEPRIGGVTDQCWIPHLSRCKDTIFMHKIGAGVALPLHSAVSEYLGILSSYLST